MRGNNKVAKEEESCGCSTKRRLSCQGFRTHFLRDRVSMTRSCRNIFRSPTASCNYLVLHRIMHERLTGGGRRSHGYRRLTCHMELWRS